MSDGTGELCGPGWLHGYDDPLVALLHNPMHANIPAPRLWRAEWGGKRRDDYGLKFGASRFTVLEELAVPVISDDQRTAYAIRCALEVLPLWAGWPREQKLWKDWARAWVDGERSAESAARPAWNARAAWTASTAWTARAARAASAESAESVAWAARAASTASTARAESAAWTAWAASTARGAPLDFPRFAREAMLVGGAR